MRKILARGVFTALVVGLLVLVSASYGQFNEEHDDGGTGTCGTGDSLGCFTCEVCGYDGLTGPAWWCCEDVGNGSGEGIACREEIVVGIFEDGPKCFTSGGPFEQVVVTP